MEEDRGEEEEEAEKEATRDCPFGDVANVSQFSGYYDLRHQGEAFRDEIPAVVAIHVSRKDLWFLGI